MTTESAKTFSPSERAVLGVFSLGHLCNDWAVGAIWLIAPAMALAFDLGPTEVGLLITVYGIGAAFAYIPAGLAADRRADVGGLLVATFWWVAVGHIVASVMPGYWSFVAVMALAVMGDAAWHPIATGYLVRRFPKRRAQVLGIHAMGGTVGAEVLAPLAVGAVLTVFDWRVALQVAVIPALVMGITFALLRHRLRPVAVEIGHKTDLAGLIRPWLRMSGRRLAVTMILYNMSVIGMVSMLPLYLARDVSLSPMVVAVIFAATLLAGSLLQAWVGALTDRHGRSKLVFSGLILGGSAAVCGAFAIAPSNGLSPFVAIAALVIAIATLTAIRSAFLASAVEVVDGRESATLALAFTVLDGVGALGALLAGIAGEGDLSYAFALCGLLSLAAIVSAERSKSRQPAYN